MPKSVEDVEIHVEDAGLIWSCFVNWVNTLEKARDFSSQACELHKID